jgi:thioredoxin-related protein
MKQFFLFSALLILFSFTKSEEINIQIGDTVSFNNKAYLNIDKKLMTLESQIKKNGLIIIFSCNTCPFVVGNEQFEGWEKQYDKLYSLAKDVEIGLVLINSNEGKRDNDDSFKEMQKHAKKVGYQMPYLVDSNSELADQLAAKTTPHVYAFNPESKLIYTGSIDNSWDSKREKTIPYLENIISEMKASGIISTEPSVPRGCSIKRVKSKK